MKKVASLHPTTLQRWKLVAFLFGAFFLPAKCDIRHDITAIGLCNWGNGKVELLDTGMVRCTDFPLNFTVEEDHKRQACLLAHPFRYVVNTKPNMCTFESVHTCQSGWSQIYDKCYMATKANVPLATARAYCKNQSNFDVPATILKVADQTTVNWILKFYAHYNKVWTDLDAGYKKNYAMQIHEFDEMPASAGYMLTIGDAMQFKVEAGETIRALETEKAEIICQADPYTTNDELNSFTDTETQVSLRVMNNVAYWVTNNQYTFDTLANKSSTARKLHDICEDELKKMSRALFGRTKYNVSAYHTASSIYLDNLRYSDNFLNPASIKWSSNDCNNKDGMYFYSMVNGTDFTVELPDWLHKPPNGKSCEQFSTVYRNHDGPGVYTSPRWYRAAAVCVAKMGMAYAEVFKTTTTTTTTTTVRPPVMAPRPPPPLAPYTYTGASGNNDGGRDVDSIFNRRGPCPAGYYHYKRFDGSYCFAVHAIRLNYPSARYMCQQAGADLATFTSFEEAAIMPALLKKNDGLTGRIWYGVRIQSCYCSCGVCRNVCMLFDPPTSRQNELLTIVRVTQNYDVGVVIDGQSHYTVPQWSQEFFACGKYV